MLHISSRYLLAITLLCSTVSSFVVAKVHYVKTEKEVSSGKPTVIDFFAEWCGPCKRLKPIFEDLSNKPEFKDVAFYAVNVEKLEGLSRKYNVRSMPTIIFLDKDGKEVERITGASNDFVQHASTIIKTKLLSGKTKDDAAVKKEVKEASDKKTDTKAAKQEKTATEETKNKAADVKKTTKAVTKK